MSDETQAVETGQAPVEQAADPVSRERRGIDVNDEGCAATYANFCRVTGTPEELIVDFGLNKNMNPQPDEPIQIAQRIIVNFYTAKRLLAALHMAVHRHETAFGVLETDVVKRVRSDRAGS